MAALQGSHRPPPNCSDEPPRVRDERDEGKKELVVIYHDESIYNSNEGQTWMWGGGGKTGSLAEDQGKWLDGL